LSNLDTERTVLFLCLLRPGSIDLVSRLGELPEGYVQTVELSLRPLEKRSARELFANLLRSEGESEAKVQPRTESILLDRSQGNPYFMEEMVIELLEDGVLQPSASGWRLAEHRGELDLPSSLGSLMRSRMDMLPADLRKSLQVASVLGTEFDGALFNRVAARLDLGDPESTDPLSSLVARNFLLLRETDNAKRYSFKSSLVHDAAYDTILLHNRRILHGCAANAMQELYPRARESFPGVITEHLYRAGDAERAIDWGLATLAQFAGKLHFEEVMFWAERLTAWIDQALEEPRKSLRTLEVLWLQHRLLDLRSRNERLEAVVTEMERIAEKTGETIWKARAKHAKGALLTHLGDNGAALQAERKALALAREASDRDTQAIVLSRMGSLLILIGKISEAEECFEKSLSISRTADDVVGIATQYANLGNVAVERGELEEAEKLLNKALAMHRRSENRRGESIVLTGLGVVNGMRGELKEAKHYFSLALDIHRDMGNRRSEGVVLGNLSVCSSSAEEVEEAVEYAERALDIHRETRNRKSMGLALVNLGSYYKRLGRIEEAVQSMKESLRLSRETGDLRTEIGAGVGLCNVLIEMGEPEEALEQYTMAIEAAERSGVGSQFLGLMDSVRKKLMAAGISERDLPLPSDR
jgi:tetratricopeptide (TPR) repeat protein